MGGMVIAGGGLEHRTRGGLDVRDQLAAESDAKRKSLEDELAARLAAAERQIAATRAQAMMTSGAAGVIANLINLLASAWSWSSGNLNFFMQNLTGNQTGDLMLNPHLINLGYCHYRFEYSNKEDQTV